MPQTLCLSLYVSNALPQAFCLCLSACYIFFISITASASFSLPNSHLWPPQGNSFITPVMSSSLPASVSLSASLPTTLHLRLHLVLYNVFYKVPYTVYATNKLNPLLRNKLEVIVKMCRTNKTTRE